MKKLVIFDIDGTLCNSKSIDEVCYEEAFYRVTGASIANVDYETFTHFTDQNILEESLARLGLVKPDESLVTNMKECLLLLLREKRDEDPKWFSEIPGAKDFLKLLLARPEEFQIGFATGAWDFSAKFKLSNIDIDPSIFPFSNSSCYTTREQIVEDCIQKASRLNNGNPFSRIIYIGDGAWDLNTCKNLNLEFIGIDVDQTGRLKELGANFVFQNFDNNEALLSLLESAISFKAY